MEKSVPVCRRTRLQETLRIKKYLEERKKEKEKKKRRKLNGEGLGFNGVGDVVEIDGSDSDGEIRESSISNGEEIDGNNGSCDDHDGGGCGGSESLEVEKERETERRSGGSDGHCVSIDDDDDGGGSGSQVKEKQKSDVGVGGRDNVGMEDDASDHDADSDDDDDHDDGGGGSRMKEKRKSDLGVGDRRNVGMDDDVSVHDANSDGDDDDVQIIGERWNPFDCDDEARSPCCPIELGSSFESEGQDTGHLDTDGDDDDAKVHFVTGESRRDVSSPSRGSLEESSSSGKDDHSDDMDYAEITEDLDSDLVESSSDNEDDEQQDDEDDDDDNGDDNDDDDDCVLLDMADHGFERKSPGTPLKEKGRAAGVQILRNCVAKRTRSHLDLKFLPNKLDGVTYDQPLRADAKKTQDVVNVDDHVYHCDTPNGVSHKDVKNGGMKRERTDGISKVSTYDRPLRADVKKTFVSSQDKVNGNDRVYHYDKPKGVSHKNVKNGGMKKECLDRISKVSTYDCPLRADVKKTFVLYQDNVNGDDHVYRHDKPHRGSHKNVKNGGMEWERTDEISKVFTYDRPLHADVKKSSVSSQVDVNRDDLVYCRDKPNRVCHKNVKNGGIEWERTDEISKVFTYDRPLCADVKKSSVSSQGDVNRDDHVYHHHKLNRVSHKNVKNGGMEWEISKVFTYDRPLRADVKKANVSSQDDANVDYHVYHYDNGVSHNNVENSGMKRERTDEISKVLNKRIRAFKNHDLEKILIDSLGSEQHGLEEWVSSANDTVGDENKSPLQLKFTYGFEQPEQPRKSEEDEELDDLWKELDFALSADDIGSSDYMVQKEDARPSESTAEQEILCSQGKHHLILDEQIGLRCEYCSFVQLEIQHVSPSFAKNPFGRPENRERFCFKLASPNELRLQDFDCESDLGPSPLAHTFDSVWDIVPGIKNGMHPHQRDGFEFIWRNIAGGTKLSDLNKPTSSTGGGCIISHAPGTGKTRLAIAFLQSYMKLFPDCKPVIIAPCSMLLTWEEEMKKWNLDAPFFNLNKEELSGKEDNTALGMLRRVRRVNPALIRTVKLFSWTRNKGIIGISYRLFEQLAGGRERTDEKVKKALLEQPGLLVLDEGHTPRNDKSLIWKALSRVETKRRIILSGTPFQNNFAELYNTLWLVRPEFADRFLTTGDIPGKRGRKSRCRARSAFINFMSDEGDKRKIAELRSRIRPFVHVHEGSILKETLPELRVNVVLLKPSETQMIVFEKLSTLKRNFEQHNLVALASVHPSLCDDLNGNLSAVVDMKKIKWQCLDIRLGVKARFLIELIQLVSKDEKVLVFSQYIPTLEFTRDLLKLRFGWTRGKEILYMDGQQEVKNRQLSIGSFNDPTSQSRVLLASTRACSEGIHLVGASRVVLLDVVWNPSVARQAVSRAYRIGQTKVVHVYNLVTGTLERDKFDQQVFKDRLSDMVFSSVNREENQMKVAGSGSGSVDRVLDAMVQHEKLKDIFEDIRYQPKGASNFIESFGLMNS